MTDQTAATLTNQYQTHFTKRLLKHAVPLLVLDQFGEQYDLPRNEGATSFRVYRRQEADATKVNSIAETDFTTLRDSPTTTGYDYVDVTLAQVGASAKITKIVTMTSLLDLLKANIERMGEEAAWYFDNVIRSAIANTTTGLTRTYAKGFADFAALKGATPAAGRLQGEAGLENVTALDLSRAPTFKGEYIGVTSPEGLYDLMQTSRWIEASKYAGATQIFRREAGMLDGVRYVKSTNNQKEDGVAGGVEGTYAASTLRSDQIYMTLYLGAQSYAVPKLAGTTSPKAPKVIILRDPDKYDPAGQYTMVTWIAFFAAMIQDRNYGRAHMHKSTYGVAA